MRGEKVVSKNNKNLSINQPNKKHLRKTQGITSSYEKQYDAGMNYAGGWKNSYI